MLGACQAWSVLLSSAICSFLFLAALVTASAFRSLRRSKAASRRLIGAARGTPAEQRDLPAKVRVDVQPPPHHHFRHPSYRQCHLYAKELVDVTNVDMVKMPQLYIGFDPWSQCRFHDARPLGSCGVNTRRSRFWGVGHLAWLSRLGSWPTAAVLAAGP